MCYGSVNSISCISAAHACQNWRYALAMATKKLRLECTQVTFIQNQSMEFQTRIPFFVRVWSFEVNEHINLPMNLPWRRLWSLKRGLLWRCAWSSAEELSIWLQNKPGFLSSTAAKIKKNSCYIWILLTGLNAYQAIWLANIHRIVCLISVRLNEVGLYLSHLCQNFNGDSASSLHLPTKRTWCRRDCRKNVICDKEFHGTTLTEKIMWKWT